MEIRSLVSVRKEWMLIAAAVAAAATSVYLNRWPQISTTEWQVVFILYVLFIAARGMEEGGLTRRLALSLERGNHIPLKLVAATFFLSMVVTNDVALVVAVPLTMALRTPRKDLIVILEALAANAGSALTPVGNPQNLFIFWSYNVSIGDFVAVIAPFVAIFLALLALAARALSGPAAPPDSGYRSAIAGSTYVHLGLFFAVILIVLRVLPVYAGIAVVAYAVVADRPTLRVDYPLLLTFIFFFALADNLRTLVDSTITSPDHVFLFSALTSQFISNVPAALLFSRFTSHWQPLLWGTNVGGFGSLIASMANLIAYRFYATHASATATGPFLLRFTVAGYGAFAVGLGLYGVIRMLA